MTNSEQTTIAEVNGIAYTRAELESKPRDGENGLKKIALSAHTERKSTVSRTWLGSAAKSSDLLAFICDNQGPGATATETNVDALTNLASALQAVLASSSGKVDKAQVEEIFEAKAGELKAELEALISANTVKRIVIEDKLTGQTVDLGTQHERFDALLTRVRIAREAAMKYHKYMNIWLVGPAGSGKTTACENVAKALNIPFEFNGALDSEHKLLGFVDAQGRIVSRPFRKVWENGGLYLFDEVDASMPGACLALNAALANGYCDFPDGKLNRHPEFVCIASGNVWNGPTEDYCGRYRPDAAFANRFIKFRFDYDERLERTLAGNDKWVDYVQLVRRNVAAKGVKVVVSPRASIFGAILLEGGVAWPDVVEETLRQGLPRETWEQIRGGNN